MRESIGGAWLFGVVIVFIFLFTGFLAYSISYTKAFNVKNEVINYIEHSEGYSKPLSDVETLSYDERETTVQGKVYNLIYATGYDFEGNQGKTCPEPKTENWKGVCVTKYCPTGTRGEATHNTAYVHYKVTTFIRFGLPFLDISVTIPITGETRTIREDLSKYPCVDELG